MQGLIIENKSNIENVITLWRGMRGIKQIQAENFKQVMELTENDKENLIKLWDSTSPAVQRENLDEVFTKYKDDEKLFQTLWAATSSQDVFLDKMMNLCGNDLKKQVELWKNMLEIFKNRQNFKKKKRFKRRT